MKGRARTATGTDDGRMKPMRCVLVIGLFAVLAGCASGSDNQDPAGHTASAGADIPVHLTTVDEAVRCSTAAKRPDPDRLLSAFRAARLAGSGAEDCLTAKARQSYCDVSHCSPTVLQASPGPICLYGCFGYRLADLTFLSLTRQKDGSLSAYTETLFRNSAGKTLRANEALVLTLHPASVQITYASSSA
jgi:hypothetical protein